MRELIVGASDLLQALSNLATILLTLISLAAAFVAYRQIKATVASQKEVTANSIFTEYLREAIKFPKFIRPKQDAFDFEKETFEGSREEFSRYEFFVDIMLTAFELIFQLNPGEDWKHEMETHFREHRSYLGSGYFLKFEKGFEPEFAMFLNSCLAQGKAEQNSIVHS